MRLILMFALVSQSFACAAVPASKPALANADVLPVDFGDTDCLDLQGQRELLAGVELEGGEQAAALARCNVQRGAAVKYGDGQAAARDAAEKRLTWAVPLSGIGGAVLGAAIAALTAWAITQASAQHAPQPAGAQ